MEEEAAASSNQTAGEDCLVGRRVSAIYHDQSVSHFRGHPLTEVFEEERSLQSIARALRSRPSIDPALRQKGPMIRMSALRADAKLFFEPMKTHLELVPIADFERNHTNVRCVLCNYETPSGSSRPPPSSWNDVQD